MLKIVTAVVLMMAGCPDRTFVNVGNNTGVPVASVREHAIAHGISFQESVRQIGAQMKTDKQRE
jgi:hypothetical protein